MTLWEVVLALEAAAWQAEQEQRRMLSLAWHVAALQRAKRLPSLRQLLGPRPKKVPIAERRREFDELNAAYHGHTARRSADPDPRDAG